MTLDNVMMYLIQKRKIVLGIIIAIIVSASAAGYFYQEDRDKQQQAMVLFDGAWQKIGYVASDIRQQPGFSYEGNQNAEPIIDFFNQGIIDLDTLITDYPDTIAAARAAVVYTTFIDFAPLMVLVKDQDLVARMKLASYLDEVKKYNKKFWGAALLVIQALQAEQKMDTASALILYQDALKKDSQKYLSDYITYSLARLYENLNNDEQAKTYYQQLIDKYPNSPWVNFAQAKLYLLSQ